MTDIELVLDRDVPAAVLPNRAVVENITYTPNVHIHKNIFKETPTRGILMTTRGEVVIEDSLFDGMGMAGIFISNDANKWYESGRTTNVTIRNNVFQRSNNQAIFVEPTNRFASPDSAVHTNHTITGNTFYIQNHAPARRGHDIKGHFVLDAKSVDGINFTNNRIIREDRKAVVTLADTPATMAVNDTLALDAQARLADETAGRLFKFVGSNNVRLEGNSYDVGLNLGSRIESGMAENHVNFAADNIAYNTDNRTEAATQVSFTSSNPDVLTVENNGTVTAKAPGIAHVRTWVTVGQRTFPGPSLTITVQGDSPMPPETPIPPVGSANDPASNADAALAQATITGLNSPFTFNEGTLHYLMTAPVETESVSLALAARDTRAQMTVTYNGATIEPSSTLRLAPGRNVIEATVTASDQVTKNAYRFVIMRSGDSNAALASLSVAGKTIELQEGVTSYAIDHPEAVSVPVEARSASPRSTVTIVHKGRVSADGSVTLVPGRNVINILVATETSAAPQRYEVVVKVPKADNALLEALDLGAVDISPEFARDTTDYTVLATASSLTVNARAEEKNATVSVHVGDTLVAQAKGALSSEVGLSEGENTVKVTVTAPDGETSKVYTLAVTAVSQVFLSDLERESATSGDRRVVQRDLSTDRRPLSVWNGSEAQTYTKGLGTHADSTIIYNIAGKGFTTFNASVGIDYETNAKPDEANVTFEVWVEDEKRYTSDEMGTRVPAASTGEINVAGASTLKLVAKEFTVAASSADAAMGSVSVDRTPGTYRTGESAVITAAPAEGHTFLGWSYAGSEDIISTEAALSLKVYATTDLVARFRANTPAVTITAGEVSVTGEPVVARPWLLLLAPGSPRALL